MKRSVIIFAFIFALSANNFLTAQEAVKKDSVVAPAVLEKVTTPAVTSPADVPAVEVKQEMACPHCTADKK